MKHTFKYIIILYILLFGFFQVNAEEVIQANKTPLELINQEGEYQNINLIKNIKFNKNLKVGETVIIDLSSIEEQLHQTTNSEIEFEWSLKGTATKQGSIFKEKFDQHGEKIINLNIYKKEDSEKKLITSKDITLFVFKEQTVIIFDTSIGQERIEQYLEKSIDSGIYVKILAQISEKEIEQQDFLQSINQTQVINTSDNNYISIWGGKNFLFSVLSKINKEITSTSSTELFNIVLVSPFNTDVINNYLRNFLSNKPWIRSILLIPESSTSQIRYNPSNINKLENDLQKKQYEYININTKSEISKILFISQFINTLSNKGFGSTSIYLLLLIPFLFTGISILKHLIGLSPIGTIVPIAMSLLFFQIGLIPAFCILVTLIITNLILSKITNKYTLLYTPKLSFIIIINIIVIMWLINVLFSYNLLNTNVSDIIFIILFIVISERLITVILSKEFSEYRFNLLNTFLFALVVYLFFSITIIQTIILAYPELILLLIPINFTIGRFTGLRITEYFRFREVIKSIEE